MELLNKKKLSETINAPTIFSNLNQTSQRRLLQQKNIIFQGEETSLKELLSPLEKIDLDDIIDSEIIAKLTKNEKIMVGRKIDSLDEVEQKCYITRKIRMNCETYPEKELCDLGGPNHQDLVCIGEDSGSGKSTLLTNTACTIKNKNPNFWVLKVDVDKYQNSFRDFKKNNSKSITLLELLDSKPESRMRSEFERKVFSIPDKVVILLDGLNEVCLEYKNLVVSLIRDCYGRNKNEHYIKYTINLLVLVASTNLQNELGWEVTHFLEPFTRESQVQFLKRYWEKKFQSDSNKCEIYAKSVINSDWYEQENKLVGHPLLLRIIAEILETSGNFDDGSSKWEGCYDFLISDNTEPVLPKKPTLVELFQLYIHKNCSENVRSVLKSVRSDVAKINSSYDCFLSNLSLQCILDEKRCEYFGCYGPETRGIPEDRVKILKIIKKSCNELHFTHRTFAEYFMAESICTELSHYKKEPFLKFLFEEVLVDDRYKVVRAFFDSFMVTDLDFMPKDTLKSIGKVMVQTAYNLVVCTCAKEGLIGILKFVLKCSKSEYIDINSARVKEGHALHFAAQGGYLDIVQFFINNGTKIDTRNKEDCMPLHLAAKSGSLPMVKFLIEGDAKIDCKDEEGRTALHIATRKGSLEMMKYLVEHGAYVNSRSKWGYTPLHIAASMGDVDRVKYLVENGAEVNCRGEHSGTVISTAILSCNVDIVRYLAEKGADVMVRNKSGGTMLQLLPKWTGNDSLDNAIKLSKFLWEKGVDINSVNHHGETALHTIIKRKYPVEFIRLLVQRGADVNAVSNSSETPLSEAISRNDVDIVKYLMENGALFNGDPNPNGKLYNAIRQRFLEVVKYLGEKGVPLVGTRDNDSSTLDIAIYNNDLEMIKLLVQKGARISSIDTLKEAMERCSVETVKYLVEVARDISLNFGEVSINNLELAKFLVEKGATFESVSDVGDNLELLKYLFDKSINVDKSEVFLKAAQNGNLSIIKLLFEKGIDINVRDSNDKSGLHLAAYRNHVSIVKYLIDHGAYIDLQDREESTPLYVAASRGCLESVKLLLDKGADIKTVTKEYDSALKYAISRGYIETARYLVEQGAELNGNYDAYLKPLSFSLATQEIDLAEFIVEHDPNFKCRLKEVVTRLLPTENKDEDQGYTLLDSIFSNVKVVKYLIEEGLELDPPAINKHGLLTNAVKENNFKLVRYLIEHGCDLESRDCCNRTALHECTNLNMVKLLVENGADVNAKAEHGSSVLRRAIEKSNFDVVEYLIEKGAKIDEVDDKDDTLLHMNSYEWGSISIDKIKHLIEKGAPFKLTKSGRSVLHDEVATFHVDLDMVKYLLTLGLDVNCRDHDGNLPLDDAISQGDLDVVRLLVEHGTEVDKDEEYTGVLFNAVQSHHHGGWDSSLDMVKYLVQKGANVNARKRDGTILIHTAISERQLEIFKFLINSGGDVNATDETGSTLLHEASSRNDFTLIKFLVDNSANLEAKTSSGRTVLHEASSCFDAIKFFVENNADVNATDREGRTPLYEASGARFSDGSVLKYLIERGAKVEVRTRKGRTPLHQAVSIHDLDKIKLLVENGAKVSARDEYGRTPMFALVTVRNQWRIFVEGSQKNVAEFLIENGANLEEKADNGRTVLHEAALSGNSVEFLVGLGADVNAKTPTGRTPLHEAARKGLVGVVEYLVKSGADSGAKTSKGLTALDEAIRGEHEEVVKFLKSFAEIEEEGDVGGVACLKNR